MDPVLLLEAVAGDALVFAATACGAPIAVPMPRDIATRLSMRPKLRL
jgi:hypothetical protein